VDPDNDVGYTKYETCRILGRSKLRSSSSTENLLWQTWATPSENVLPSFGYINRMFMVC